MSDIFSSLKIYLATFIFFSNTIVTGMLPMSYAHALFSIKKCLVAMSGDKTECKENWIIWRYYCESEWEQSWFGVEDGLPNLDKILCCLAFLREEKEKRVANDGFVENIFFAYRHCWAEDPPESQNSTPSIPPPQPLLHHRRGLTKKKVTWLLMITMMVVVRVVKLAANEVGCW